MLRHHALLDALMHCVLGALDTLCMGGLEPTCRNVPLNTVSQNPSQKKSTGCFGPKQGFAKLPSWTFTSRCSCILPCVAGRSHGRGASCASQGGTHGFMRDCTNSGSQRHIFFACTSINWGVFIRFHGEDDICHDGSCSGRSQACWRLKMTTTSPTSDNIQIGHFPWNEGIWRYCVG